MQVTEIESLQAVGHRWALVLGEPVWYPSRVGRHYPWECGEQGWVGLEAPVCAFTLLGRRSEEFIHIS